MSRLSLIHLSAFVLTVACAPMGEEPGEESSEPDGHGTEIGEEGGGEGGCSATRTTLDGPDAVPPGMDRSVAELADPWAGAFSSDEATVSLEFDLSAPVFVDREPPPDAPALECRDTVLFPAVVAFAQEGVSYETPAGEVELRTDSNLSLLSAVTVYDAATGETGLSDQGTEAIPADPGTLSTALSPDAVAAAASDRILLRVYGAVTGGDDARWFLHLGWRWEHWDDPADRSDPASLGSFVEDLVWAGPLETG